MGKNCKFLTSWSEKDDGQGYKVGEWATKTQSNDNETYCKVCMCNIDVSQKGFQAVTQHASTTKHKKNMIAQKSVGQMHLINTPAIGVLSSSGIDTSNKNPSVLQLCSVRDQTTRAELIWTMKSVASNFSASSCNDLKATFQAMFGLNTILQNFSLGRTKITYLITEALAPYFKNEQRKEIGDSYFTLLYDETTNAAGRKELHTAIRYWCDSTNRVVTQHLETFFMGKAKADDLLKKINEVMSNENLSFLNLLMIGSDGPNVNKAVLKKMDQEILKFRKKSLINIGTCNIHTTHNAFRKSMKELGENASDLLYFLHDFFNGWPGRWDDFCVILEKHDLPLYHFLRHVPQRWLTIEDAGKRALLLWKAIKYYFFEYILKEKKDKTLTESLGYRRIVNLLKIPTMKAEVMFVVSSAKIFAAVTHVFQKEEPLIHLLYPELKNLITILIGRSCKNTNLAYSEVFNKSNLLQPEKVVVDEIILDELDRCGDTLAKTQFLMKARNHYVFACQHMLKKSSLQSKNNILSSVKCLHPSERQKSSSISAIVTAAKALPFEVQTDILIDEWKLLQEEKHPETDISNIRIDEYWSHFFAMKNSFGGRKYPLISKIVKALLSLSHGNADVERGCSTSALILTDNRASMSEKTLNSYMVIKYALKKYNNLPHAVPITQELLNLARMAHQKYNEYLEEQRKTEEQKRQMREEEKIKKEEEKKRLEERELNKKKLEAEEKKLVQLRQLEDVQAKRANKLLKEASERLKKGIEKKNMEEIALAEAMLTGVSKLHEEAQEQRKQARDKEKIISKRKNNIVDYFSKKAKKE